MHRIFIAGFPHKLFFRLKLSEWQIQPTRVDQTVRTVPPEATKQWLMHLQDLQQTGWPPGPCGCLAEKRFDLCEFYWRGIRGNPFHASNWRFYLLFLCLLHLLGLFLPIPSVRIFHIQSGMSSNSISLTDEASSSMSLSDNQMFVKTANTHVAPTISKICWIRWIYARSNIIFKRSQFSLNSCGKSFHLWSGDGFLRNE